MSPATINVLMSVALVCVAMLFVGIALIELFGDDE